MNVSFSRYVLLTGCKSVGTKLRKTTEQYIKENTDFWQRQA